MKYIRSSENITSKIHDEIVMVDIHEGNYYGLNQVGSDIWELLDKPMSPGELCNVLTDKYEIDPETCEKDIQVFIDDMISKNLIQPVE